MYVYSFATNGCSIAISEPGHSCLSWVSSDEDKAVLGWTVALLSFLDLPPCAAALMADCCLPVEHSVSAPRTTEVYSFSTTGTQPLPIECTFIVLCVHTGLIPGHLPCSCHHCTPWREVHTLHTLQNPLLCSASSVCVAGSPVCSGMSATPLWIPCRIYGKKSKVMKDTVHPKIV